MVCFSVQALCKFDLERPAGGDEHFVHLCAVKISITWLLSAHVRASYQLTPLSGLLFALVLRIIDTSYHDLIVEGHLPEACSRSIG